MMAVWTPGSYLVREYARHRRGHLGQRPGREAPGARRRCGRTAGGCRPRAPAEVIVSYRVYARTMSVQGNWVDGSFALLNGAGTFLTLADSARSAARGDAGPARGWKTSVTGLPAAAGGSRTTTSRPISTPWSIRPIYAGNPARLRVPGRRHAPLPRQRGRGGPLGRPAVGPRRRGDRPGAEGLLGLAPVREVRLLQPPDRERRRARAQELDRADGQPLGHPHPHELPRRGSTSSATSIFHTWNVKRLRPVELGPFDYENEVYTPSLWVAEGITSYYDRLLVRRAGLCSVEEYLAGDPPSPGSDADKTDQRHRAAPDHARPARAAAGGVVVRRLDQVLPPRREHPEHRHQLLREGGRGRLPARRQDPQGDRRQEEPRRRDAAGLRALFGADRASRPSSSAPSRRRSPASTSSAWFRKALETTEELDYAETLDWFGLRFAKDEKKNGNGEQASQGLARAGGQERGRPADGQPGQARHARIRGGLQRRRRDPRHRRRPRSRPTSGRSGWSTSAPATRSRS